jgi:hypothetical protein
MASNYNNAYTALIALVENMGGNSNYRVVKYELDALSDKLKGLRAGNLLYNKRNAFLHTRKQCVTVDANILLDNINTIYDVAVKCDTMNAPKSTVFEVKLNTSIFFL